MALVIWTNLSALCAVAAALASCAAAPKDTLALLATKDPATLQAVSSKLRQVEGTQRVELGPMEGDYTSVITLLPPALSPNETRSVARPELFDVVKRSNACFLVRRTTGTAYALNGVTCINPPRAQYKRGPSKTRPQ